MTDERKAELIAAIAQIFPRQNLPDILAFINRNSGTLFRGAQVASEFKMGGLETVYCGRTTIQDAHFVPILFLANVGLEALGGLEKPEVLPAKPKEIEG